MPRSEGAKGGHGCQGVRAAKGGRVSVGGGYPWGSNPVAVEAQRTTICWVPRRTLRIIRKAFSPLVCFSRTTNSIPALAAATTSGSVTLTGVPAPEVSLRRLPSLSTAYSELYSSTVSP